MSIRTALAAGLIAIALGACSPVRNSPNGPGNSQDSFAPAANLDDQAQPPYTGAHTRAETTERADPNPPGPANRDGNPGYGYILNAQPRPD
jgi:hypothetical protein